MRRATPILALAPLLLLNAVLAVPPAEAAVGAVVISEVHYNPDGPAEGHEFVELQNVSNSTVTLAGWSFSNGIDLTLPPITLASGAHFVAAADAAAFEAVHGFAPDADFAGTLSNGGETITLVDAGGQLVDEVTYDDLAPWPVAADGDGRSLNLIDPTAPERDASAWASGLPTPGDDALFDLELVFSVERGWYDGAVTLELTSTIPGAVITWSDDTLDPHRSYAGPITVPDNGATRTIRARATLGATTTPIISHTYVFMDDTGIPVAAMWSNGLPVAAGESESTVLFEFIPPPSVPLPAVAEHAGTSKSSGGAASGTSDKLFFRNDYGAGTLNADLFSDLHHGALPTNEHDQLFIRARHQDSHHIRNIVSLDSFAVMRDIAPHGRYVVFIDRGVNVGARVLLERPEAGFMESYTGIDKDLWEAYSASGASGYPADWAEFSRLVDVEQMIDFHINQWFADVWDFGPSRNWRIAKPAVPAQADGDQYAAHFFIWDHDHAYRYPANSWANTAFRSPNYIFGVVDDQPPFQRMFADRVQCHLGDPDGTLRAAQMGPRIDARVAELAATGWNASAAVTWAGDMLPWIETKRDFLLSQFRANDLLQNRRAVDVTVVNGVLTISDPNPDGSIYYRLDGGDVRTAAGTLDPAAIPYNGPVALAAGRHTVIARSHAPAADQLERFTPSCNRGRVVDVDAAGGAVVGADLVITELHYNPPTVAGGPDGDLREFVEITNTGDAPVNLAGFTLSGTGLTFPGGSTIAAGARMVVASDTAEFSALHGFAPDHTYPGRLDDGGERIGLVNAVGQLVDEVVYDDAAPWPTDPDGGGPSLELRSDDADNALAVSWRAAPVDHGSPAAGNVTIGDVNCDDNPDIVDALVIAQFTVGNRAGASCPMPNPATGIALDGADVNVDGSVDIVDALVLSQCTVGIVNPWCSD